MSEARDIDRGREGGRRGDKEVTESEGPKGMGVEGRNAEKCMVR